jgi:light-regulated signal transduction histidine kinase (bacteriophytochrome)
MLRIREMEEKFEHTSQELEQFVYLSTHSLSEPMRMVTQYMGILERDLGAELSDRNHLHISFAITAAKRMQSLLADLLLYTRTSLTQEPSVMVDLNVVMTEVMEHCRPIISDSAATIDVQQLPTVPGVKSQLVLVFQQLVDNALKFRSQQTPRITIWAEAQPDACVIHVRDNGIGIDPAYHSTIFRIFQRLHTQEQYPGTGMGLAICRMIVQQHGGQVDLSSEIGQGTTFTIRLPSQPMAQIPQVVKVAL